MKIIQEKELTTKARNDLPTSAFALPKERKYPIPDEAHARNALARVAANGTDAEKRAVRAAVRKKFPGIEVTEESALRESGSMSWEQLPDFIRRGIEKTLVGIAHKGKLPQVGGSDATGKLILNAMKASFAQGWQVALSQVGRDYDEYSD